MTEPPSEASFYIDQGFWTAPGLQGASIVGHGKTLEELAEYVQGLLVHDDYLSVYGFTASDFPGQNRDTRKLSDRFESISSNGSASRQLGTCRDYALALCGLLRENGQPARVRCGFADYLSLGRWEDHWVCEYWSEEAGGWLLADAQLDVILRSHLKIELDSLALPEGRFLTAADAWRAIRGELSDPPLFGHGDEACGARFILVNLVRDLLALSKQEVSPWDTWREALPWQDGLSSAEIQEGDDLAAQIEAREAGRVRGSPFLPERFW